jgi:hypothetical protein
MFNNKQIPLVICFVILVAVLLFGVTGCGGGSKKHSTPTSYRVSKIEDFNVHNSSHTLVSQSNIAYGTDGTPFKIEHTDYEDSSYSFTGNYTLTFQNGKLMSYQISGRGEEDFQYTGDFITKITMYKADNTTVSKTVDLTYMNGKITTGKEIYYNDPSESIYLKYTYDNDKISRIDQYSDINFSDDKLYCYDKFTYDSNGNLSQIDSYELTGGKLEYWYCTKYTWEQGQTNYDWNYFETLYN